jgi:hypothetical protein
MHDRQFGGAGIAEQMRDALILEQGQERRTPGDTIFHDSSRSRPLPSSPRSEFEVAIGGVASLL